MHRRRLLIILASLTLLLGGIAVVAVPAAAVEWVAGTVPGGRLEVTPGAPLLVLEGTPAEQGAAMGHLTGPIMGHLIGTIRLGQLFSDGDRLARLRQAVPTAMVEELTAAAQAAGLDPEALITANLVVDSHCSALVAPPEAGQPLRVARNMDFFPAKLLGPGTLLTVWRRPGVRPVVGIGWPGYAGIVSGMNDAGLTVCILLQHHAAPEADGTPLAFRLRQVLESCATVEEAAAALRAQPPASRHYVLVADATTAAVLWREGTVQHRDDLGAGWLAASNGPRREGAPDDRRGRCLTGLGAACRATGQAPTDAWLRRALTASYMKGINAQAMVLIPGLTQLQLATGTGWTPAAKAAWFAYDLGPVLAGAPLPPVTALGATPDPLPWGGR